MALDPNIALGVRPLEIANPLAQYSQIAQIQNAQQANQLNQMKMAEYELEKQNKNALSAAYARSFDPTSGKVDYNKLTGLLASGGQGTQIPAVLKQRTEEDRAATEEAARRAKLTADTQAMYQNLSGQIGSKQDAVMFLQRMLNDPAMKDAPITKIPLMEQVRRIPEDPQGLDNWVKQFSLGATKYITENKPTTQQVNRGGATELYQTAGLGGAPKLVGSYADLPLPAAVEAQNLRKAAASRPITTITNVQEKAEAGERGKMLVNQYSDISKSASLAAKTLPAIESNLSALNKGFDTGFGKETVAAGASVLAALGVKNAEKFASDTQQFQSNAISAVLQKQLEQKGPQTESDARRIEQIGAQLGKTKNANEFILSMAKEQLRRDVDQRNFYDRWYKTNKTYDGAEDAWFSSEGGKSLFDRPALKKYGASAASQIPGQTPTPASAVTPNIDALLNKYK